MCVQVTDPSLPQPVFTLSSGPDRSSLDFYRINARCMVSTLICCQLQIAIRFLKNCLIFFSIHLTVSMENKTVVDIWLMMSDYNWPSHGGLAIYLTADCKEFDFIQKYLCPFQIVWVVGGKWIVRFIGADVIVWSDWGQKRHFWGQIIETSPTRTNQSFVMVSNPSQVRPSSPWPAQEFSRSGQM